MLLLQLIEIMDYCNLLSGLNLIGINYIINFRGILLGNDLNIGILNIDFCGKYHLFSSKKAVISHI